MRSGHARQYAIGMRMSGLPSCAMSEPSQNSTRLCTIDCGWTRTSICAGASAKMMGLDQLEPLVHQGGRIDRHFRAHRPVGMLEACSTVAVGFLGARGSERTSGGGENDAAHVLAPAAAHGLKQGVVLGIDRQHGGT